MRKTVYVILVLCCFIIKTYSINRPYYHTALSFKIVPQCLVFVEKIIIFAHSDAGSTAFGVSFYRS